MHSFSRRAHWDAETNRLSLAREAYRGRLIDLTVSNPTAAEIPYPLGELAEVMGKAARQPYDPQPLGIRSARETIAQSMGAHPDDIVITASTSEAYSFLFKLLTDPGDEVLLASPSYPLLEHLAAMESTTLATFPLRLHRRWETERDAIEPVISSRTRAIVVVNPNNPTGSFVTPAEQQTIASFGVPLVSDEVFLDYSFGTPAVSMVRDDVLTFTLGGLSKSAGLPHFKLGWIRVSGPAAARRAAVDALELIADNFLSVGGPVQHALPALIELGAGIRAAISARTSANLRTLETTLGPFPSASILPLEGGWSAVVRIPGTRPDEDVALDLLGNHGVVIHPGYFFDFASDGFMVLSLLTPEAAFRAGLEKITLMID